MSELTKLCKELIELRAKATPGEWSSAYYGERIKHGPSEKYPEGGDICRCYEGDAFIDDIDADLTCLAANNITKICEAAILMREALEHYKHLSMFTNNNDGTHTTFFAQNAIDQVNKIMEQK